MIELHLLNAPQREAVTSHYGPLLILAGAGTGKTRVITCRIAHMIHSGVSPDRILAVTFTNKAAREMKERAGTLIDKDLARKLTVSTFHSWCVKILRQDIGVLGYKTNFTIYSDSEQLGLVKKLLVQYGGANEKVDPRAVLAMISKQKNQSIRSYIHFTGKEAGNDTSDGTQRLSAQDMASLVWQRYQRGLKSCNAVDFDDLLLLTITLFEKHPEILKKYQQKYHFVMVDEFQDTNDVQFQLLHALTKVHRNLCVVGDDDQSIYGWRGAQISNILDFEKHFPAPKIVKLEQNYRSTNSILEAANSIIRNNARRRPKQLWSDQGKGDSLTLLTVADDTEEARRVSEEILELRRKGKMWSDCAVLFRMNTQSRVFEEEFRRNKIPYFIIGGQSFYDRREIQDVMAYLKILYNPNDDVSLLRIINTPPRGIGDVTIDLLMEHSQKTGASLWKCLTDSELTSQFSRKTQENIELFIRQLEQTREKFFADHEDSLHAQKKTASGGVLLKEFLSQVGYIEDLKRSCKDGEEAFDRVNNVEEMGRALDNYSSREPAGGLGGFLENVVLASDLDRENNNKEGSESDAVTLITLHSCKGLEYPHVFLVGVEDGILPHERSKAEGTLDEERRLFYVGITRAMKTLTISHCESRKRYGQNFPCHPSPFLKEIPSHLLERIDTKKPMTEDVARKRMAALKDMFKSD